MFWGRTFRYANRKAYRPLRRNHLPRRRRPSFAARGARAGRAGWRCAGVLRSVRRAADVPGREHSGRAAGRQEADGVMLTDTERKVLRILYNLYRHDPAEINLPALERYAQRSPVQLLEALGGLRDKGLIEWDAERGLVRVIYWRAW